jgi:hypothetical protein
VRTYPVHRRRPEADLAGAIGKVAVDGRKKERSSDGGAGHGSYRHLVDDHLDSQAFGDLSRRGR